MYITDPNLYSGPLFEILAGPNRKSLLAHASVLRQSITLTALIDGQWKEGLERQIVLAEWDPDTVSRLLEWLYRGDYSWALPEAPAEEDSINRLHQEASSKVEDSEFHSRLIALNHPVKADKERIEQPLIDIGNQNFGEVAPRYPMSSLASFNAWVLKHRDSSETLSYETAILAHAKVYCLADYMILTELQALAFQGLKSILDFMSPLGPGIPAIEDLATLIKYVYANTACPYIDEEKEQQVQGEEKAKQTDEEKDGKDELDREESGQSNGLENGEAKAKSGQEVEREGKDGRGKEEPLRKLISTFIAVRFSTFHVAPDSAVQGLIDEGGDFAVDVWNKVRRNLSTLEAEKFLSVFKAGKYEARIRELEEKVQELETAVANSNTRRYR